MKNVDDSAKAKHTRDLVQWVEDDSTEDEYIALIACEKGELIEQHFSFA